MEHPEKFGNVVCGVFLVNVAQKAAFSLTGIFAYGLETAEVYSDNLPEVPLLAISGLIVLNTWSSFPLPLVPVFKELISTESACQAGLQRSLLVLVVGCAAAAVPSFTLAMGLTGSFTLAFLTFIFPALFSLKLHGARMGVVKKASCWFVVLTGVLGGLAGIASNLSLAGLY